MKIKHKLLILVLIPLLAFFYQSIRDIGSNLKIRSIVSNMNDNAKFFKAVSGVINELQKERGITVLFTAGGTAFDTVQQKRQDSDKALEAFENAIQLAKLSPDLIQKAKQIPNSISSIRNQVDNKTLSTKKSVKTTYTNLVKQLFSLQAGVANAKTTKGFGKVFNSLMLLETAKENAGLLRATMSSLLAENKPLTNAQLNEIMNYKSNIDASLNSPALVITKSSRELLKQSQQKDYWIKVNRTFAMMIEKSQTGKYGVNGKAFFGTITNVVNDIGKLVDENLTDMDTRMKVVLSDTNLAVIFSFLIFFIAASISIAFSIKLAYSITRPLYKGIEMAEAIRMGDTSHRLDLKSADELGALAGALNAMADVLNKHADVTAQIAQGKLDVDVHLASEKDTFGKSLQQMVNDLSGLVGLIKQSTFQISAGALEIGDASQSLAQGATQQAASLEEISSSMTELASQTKANAENATQVNSLATMTKDKAEAGGQDLAEMVDAMDEISAASTEIAKIIKTIDDIAFQTNILALNAAVEAARAGVHGKGFAVVADEVRTLAGRSAKAAAETAEMIEKAVAKIEHGKTISGNTEQSFKTIMESILKVSDIAGEISAASSEQAKGVSEVDIGLSEIDKVTQQNTACSEETAASAQELSHQTKQMRLLVERFKLKNETSVSPAPVKTVQPVKPAAPLPKPPTSQAVAPSPSKPAPNTNSSSWGAPGNQPPVKTDSKQDFDQIISLEDKDFGRY